MKVQARIPLIVGWTLGTIVAIIGVLNLFFVHPVPGIVFILLSLLYFPPADVFFNRCFGRPVPNICKIILFIVITWFTLGVSDLGDMID
jgi:hypothetical protein